MASHRIEKINGQIQRELSLIIRNRMKDSRLNKDALSIVRVSTTGDLSQSTVYVSVLGSEEDKANAMASLEHAKGFLRSCLGKTLNTHSTPALIFKLDDSVEYSMHIESILAELKKGEQVDDSQNSSCS